MPLSAKQLRFVDEFLVDLNATQAAIRAGYSAKTARQIGSRMLSNVDIADAVAAAQASRARRTGITVDRVVQELARLGFSDIRNVVNWSGSKVAVVTDPKTSEESLRTFNEVTLLDSAELDPDTAAAITEVSQSKDGTVKVKLADKVQPLVKIGLHLGMFRPVRKPADPEAAADAATPAIADEMEGLLN